MAKKLQYGKGKARIIIDGEQKELLEKALKFVAGDIIAILEQEIEDRIKYAEERWLVRGDKPIELEDGRTRIVKQKSEGSYQKFSSTLRILKRGNKMEAEVSNDAPYAYAIRAATYSKNKDGIPTTIPEGERVVDHVLWKPAKKAVPKLVSKLAKSYIKNQK